MLQTPSPHSRKPCARPQRSSYHCETKIRTSLRMCDMRDSLLRTDAQSTSLQSDETFLAVHHTGSITRTLDCYMEACMSGE